MTSASADPGATPLADRALAPDLARGLMLLLIALANVTAWVHAQPQGVRGYPPDPAGADQIVTIAQLTLVDGRAFPLFGLLFGYGIGQLARRRAAVGMAEPAVIRLVRRRGWWLLLIGALHGVLLFPGDIVGAYGLLGVLLAVVLVRGSNQVLGQIAVTGVVLVALLGVSVAAEVPDGVPLLSSMAVADPLAALAARALDWISGGLPGSVLSVFGAVALGALACRHRLLDEPERHRALLGRLAFGGLSAAVLGGLPLAMAAGGLVEVPSGVLSVLGALHALSGYAGGIGYAALFGLVAAWLVARDGGPGRVVGALRACGQRSLSCYLAQSVAFAALLPAWTLGLGAQLRPGVGALLAVSVWLTILLIAAGAAALGVRGPAELALRRLTYGRT